MLKPFEFYEAARLAQMCSGGGGTTTETLYDRISKLPTVFAFDIADKWRCELCADSDPIECPQSIGNRYDDWSEEYTSTVVVSKPTKAFYLRIFKGSELKMVTNAVQTDSVTKWYASDGTNVGDLKKTVVTAYSDFSVSSVGVYNTNALYLPSVSLGYKMTQTTDGTAETYNGSMGYISPSTRYFAAGEIDPNTYADFVKAVRKMSDEYNKTEEVIE